MTMKIVSLLAAAVIIIAPSIATATNKTPPQDGSNKPVVERGTSRN
jgi:hypothetical protein